MQNLDFENYKTLLKKIKKTQINDKTSHVHGLEGLIVKRAILPNLFYRFNEFSCKIPTYFLIEIDKLILKFIWKGKWNGRAKSILKKNKSDDSYYVISNLLSSHEIKTVWYSGKDWHSWKSPENDPHCNVNWFLTKV